MNSIAKETLRVNRMIRVPQVRVVDAEGNQLGIMATRDALALAESSGLDLVEVAANAAPPVCRIMDFGKFKYQQSKKAKEAKKKQTVIHIKEIKLRAATDEHDFQFKLRNIRKFLSDGDKVKVTLQFRGREITHTEIGMNMLKRVIDEAKDMGTVEAHPKLEGRSMSMMLAPSQVKVKPAAGQPESGASGSGNRDQGPL